MAKKRAKPRKKIQNIELANERIANYISEEYFGRVVRSIAEEAKKYAQNIIMEDWYNRYTPVKYMRTFDTYHSLDNIGEVKKSTHRYGEKFSINLRYDINQLRLTRSPYWQHTSMFTGNDERRKVIDAVENKGLWVPVKGQTKQLHGPTHALERASNYISENYGNIVSQTIYKSGSGSFRNIRISKKKKSNIKIR